MSPRSVFLPLLGHELHLMEWGEPSNPTIVMWHGLARNGRDFDELAAALSDEWFVLCPDTIGRGLSSWAETPDEDYTLTHYGDLAVAMLDHYGIDTAVWIGTSMGGQIGMTVAGATAPDRIRTLVINDIGPEVPDVALDRIVTYSADLPVFGTVAEAEAWLREVYIPFGPASDAFWARMAEASVRRRDDGQLTLHYDPRIIPVLDGDRQAMNLWGTFGAISAPVHVLRGRTSDLLTEDIATRMAGTGPMPGVTLFDDCAHAPTLSRDDDIVFVRTLLGKLLPG